MSILEIETAITKLKPTEIDRLMAWLADYREQVWDREIESDLDSGKLKDLLSDVDSEIAAGLAQPV
jgi:hypothetical protein